MGGTVRAWSQWGQGHSGREDRDRGKDRGTEEVTEPGAVLVCLSFSPFKGPNPQFKREQKVVPPLKNKIRLFEEIC